MSIRNVHHVGIIVEDMERACAFWRDAVGLPVQKEGVLSDGQGRAALLSMGNSFIELLQPLGEDSGLARSLAQRGPGLHHICLETPDIEGELEALKARGVVAPDARAIDTFAGRSVFVEPELTQSVAVEVVQPEFATQPGRHEPGSAFVAMPIVATLTGDLMRSAGEWERNFGLQVEAYLIAPEGDNRHVVIPTGERGSVYIEVITPLSAEGKNMAYLRKVGDAMFQISARLDDVDKAVSRLNDAGFPVMQTEGMDAGRTARFMHPKTTGGVFLALFPLGPIPSGPIPY